MQMKPPPLLTCLILCLAFFAGNITGRSQTIQDEMIFGVVIYKLNNEKSDVSASPGDLSLALSFAKPTSVRQLFPSAGMKRGGRGKVDLSAIFELRYDADIPPTEMARLLERMPGIAYAQPRYITRPLYSPNDSLLSAQYYLDVIKARQAWDVCLGDSNTVVGISDTGFDLFHDDLVDQLAYNRFDPINGIDDDNDGYVDNFRGWNFVKNNNDPGSSTSNHGTQVAGIVAARHNNHRGIAGVGGRCKLLPVKITSDDNSNVFDYESIVYMANHGASVINCSWGGLTYQPYGQDLVNYAVLDRDVVVVASAGNSNSTQPVYPAALDNVLSVAATTTDDKKWTPKNMGSKGGSSYGVTVDISAPGVSMRTLDIKNNYTTASYGTSYSAPVVAGAVALVRSHRPWLSARQVVEQLKVTADIIDTIPDNAPYRNMLGSGRLNMYKALTDTIKPSVKFLVSSDLDPGKTSFMPGDTVCIEGRFINYLHRNDTVNLSVTSPYKYFEVAGSPRIVPPLATGEKSSVISICIVLSKSIPFDARIDLLLTFKAGGYSDYQYISFYANSSIVTIEKNNIKTSVTSSGSIGFANTQAIFQGHGFAYKGVQLIDAATLVIASDTTQLLLNWGQKTDFSPNNAPRVTKVGGKTTVHSSYTGRFQSSIDFMFSINQRTSAWDSDSSFILCEYDIINTSLAKVDSLNVGLLIDWSIGNSSINTLSVDTSGGFAVARSLDRSLPLAGAALFSDLQLNHYVFESIDLSNPIIYSSTGISPAGIIHIMKNNKTLMVTPKNIGTNVLQVINLRNVSLEVGDTIRFAAVLFATDREDYILPTIRRAESLYGNNVSAATILETREPLSFEVLNNPVTNKKLKVLLLSDVTQNVEFQITNCVGNDISKHHARVNKGAQVLVFPVENGGGVYFIRLLSKGVTSCLPFVIE